MKLGFFFVRSNLVKRIVVCFLLFKQVCEIMKDFTTLLSAGWTLHVWRCWTCAETFMCCVYHDESRVCRKNWTSWQSQGKTQKVTISFTNFCVVLTLSLVVCRRKVIWMVTLVTCSWFVRATCGEKTELWTDLHVCFYVSWLVWNEWFAIFGRIYPQHLAGDDLVVAFQMIRFCYNLNFSRCTLSYWQLSTIVTWQPVTHGSR